MATRDTKLIIPPPSKVSLNCPADQTTMLHSANDLSQQKLQEAEPEQAKRQSGRDCAPVGEALCPPPNRPPASNVQSAFLISNSTTTTTRRTKTLVAQAKPNNTICIL